MRAEAHFCNPCTHNELTCAYTHAVDWPRLRERLRVTRERLKTPEGKKLTLTRAAKKSGVNRSTIHSLENIKREPNLIPETATLVALAQAYDLKLWPLIREAEEVSDRKQIPIEESLTPDQLATNNSPSSISALIGDLDGGTAARVLSATDSGSSINTPASDILIGSALIDAGTFLVRRGEEAGGIGSEVAPPPPPKSGPRSRGTRHR